MEQQCRPAVASKQTVLFRTNQSVHQHWIFRFRRTTASKSFANTKIIQNTLTQKNCPLPSTARSSTVTVLSRKRQSYQRATTAKKLIQDHPIKSTDQAGCIKWQMQSFLIFSSIMARSRSTSCCSASLWPLLVFTPQNTYLQAKRIMTNILFSDWNRWLQCIMCNILMPVSPFYALYGLQQECGGLRNSPTKHELHFQQPAWLLIFCSELCRHAGMIGVFLKVQWQWMTEQWTAVGNFFALKYSELF